MLNNNGFVLIGGCGEDVESGKEEVYFSPGKDDKVFRLEVKATAVCHNEEQKAKPIRPGKPLRERFQEHEVFCFGRDYDAAPLAKHPQQKVTSIRVGRLNPAEERRDAEQKWPDGVKLSVELTLKMVATRHALKYVCDPQEASWKCTAEPVPNTGSTCDDATVHLARGEGDDILLINRQEGLPIDASCQAKHESTPNAERHRRAPTTRLSVLSACRARRVVSFSNQSGYSKFVRLLHPIGDAMFGFG